MALEEIVRRQFGEADRSLVQDQVIAALQADPEAFIDAYRKHLDSFGGRYVATDLAKTLFEQYAASRENRGRYNMAVHNAAAVLAGEQFRRAIRDESDPARTGALFLTGMPGAGKTSAVQVPGKVLGLDGFAPGQRVIFEGQMINPVTSIEKVGQALAAGLQASLMALLPKPEDALANTFRRFQELGRGAGIDVMAQIQEGLPAGLRTLRREFGDQLEISVWDIRVRSTPVRHEGESGIVIIEKELEDGSVRDRLLATAERFRDAGAIDDDCYRQCRGLAPYQRQFGVSAGHDGQLEAGARG